mgnify:CR=1 FL=1
MQLSREGKNPVAAPVVNSRVSLSSDRWKLPDAGWVKLNTDGSVDVNGRAGAGMVLRDDKGAIIFSACRDLFARRDALEAEVTSQWPSKWIHGWRFV